MKLEDAEKAECKYMGCGGALEVVRVDGVHYAKAVCKSCRRFHDWIAKPKNQITVTLPRETIDALHQRARETECATDDLVNFAILDYLKSRAVYETVDGRRYEASR